MLRYTDSEYFLHKCYVEKLLKGLEVLTVDKFEETEEQRIYKLLYPPAEYPGAYQKITFRKYNRL